MTAETGDAVELAARRLERALALLEQRLALKLAEASAGADGAFDQDRAQLATALDDARARERELEEAGAGGLGGAGARHRRDPRRAGAASEPGLTGDLA